MSSFITVLIVIGCVIALSGRKKSGRTRNAPTGSARETLHKGAKAAMQAGVPPKAAAAVRQKTNPKPQPAQAAKAGEPSRTESLPVIRTVSINQNTISGSLSFTPAPEFIGEGEAPEEHSQHVRAMRDAEAARREERKELRDLRHTNRAQLRKAIVLSEILSDPVSLRKPRF